MKLVFIQQEANSENDQAVALSLYFEGSPTLKEVEDFVNNLSEEENLELRDKFKSGCLIEQMGVWEVPNTPIMRDGLTRFQACGG